MNDKDGFKGMHNKREQQLSLFSGVNTDKPKPEGPFSRHVVYVDESGDHSLQSIDQNYPIFVLAFCVFHKGYYGEVIVPALEALNSSILGMIKSYYMKMKLGAEKALLTYLKTGLINKHL